MRFFGSALAPLICGLASEQRHLKAKCSHAHLRHPHSSVPVTASKTATIALAAQPWMKLTPGAVCAMSEWSAWTACPPVPTLLASQTRVRGPINSGNCEPPALPTTVSPSCLSELLVVYFLGTLPSSFLPLSEQSGRFSPPVDGLAAKVSCMSRGAFSSCFAH